MGYIIIGVLVITLIVVVVFYRMKARKLIVKLNKMIIAGKNGNFSETSYDETMLSAVENNFYNFLSSSSTSKEKIHNEKESIIELIADISHQTKTPLANILLYTELLLENDLTEDCLNYANLLARQSEKLNFLIQSLIKTSRLETGVVQLSPKLYTVNELLEDVSNQVKHKELIIEDTDVAALFDKKWTSEAIYNIVDNAFKYSQNSVRIKVTAYDLFCRIDIIDTGIGISESEQAQIFCRFYRSGKSCEVEGVGIGLFLAREIIKAQDGYIKVSSKVGVGSTFSVFLPMNCQILQNCKI